MEIDKQFIQNNWHLKSQLLWSEHHVFMNYFVKLIFADFAIACKTFGFKVKERRIT